MLSVWPGGEEGWNLVLNKVRWIWYLITWFLNVKFIDLGLDWIPESHNTRGKSTYFSLCPCSCRHDLFPSGTYYKHLTSCQSFILLLITVQSRPGQVWRTREEKTEVSIWQHSISLGWLGSEWFTALPPTSVRAGPTLRWRQVTGRS